MFILFSTIAQWANRTLFGWLFLTLLSSCGHLRYHQLEPNQQQEGNTAPSNCPSLLNMLYVKGVIDTDDSDQLTQAIQHCDQKILHTISWIDYLKYAAANNKIKTLTVLLDEKERLKLNLNARGGDLAGLYGGQKKDFHVLRTPIYFGYKEVIEKLIHAGAHVKYMCVDPLIALIKSCPKFDSNPFETCEHPESPVKRQDRLQIAQVLIEDGAVLNGMHGKGGFIPLVLAARTGQKEMVELFLKKGSPVDAINISGETPFYAALSQGHIEIAEYLARQQADLEIVPLADRFIDLHKGNRAWHYASKFGSLNVVKLLVEQRANIEAKNSEGNTPLHLASLSGQLEVVKYLIEQRANIEAKNSEGNTPLHLASLSGQLKVVEYLIEQKADIEAKNRDGNMPLHLAAQLGQLEVVDLLLNKGSKMEAKNNEDNTSLHVTSSSGQLQVVKFLLEQKANIEAQNNDKNTPLHLAVGSQQIEVVAELVEQGANIEAENINGHTPIYMAAVLKYCKVFSLLNSEIDSISVEAKGSTSDSTTTLPLCNHKVEESIQQFLAASSGAQKQPEDIDGMISSSDYPDLLTNQTSGASQLQNPVQQVLSYLLTQGVGYGSGALSYLLAGGQVVYGTVGATLNQGDLLLCDYLFSHCSDRYKKNNLSQRFNGILYVDHRSDQRAHGYFPCNLTDYRQAEA